MGKSVTKEKPSKKAKEKENFPQRVGIIDTILTTLRKATSKKPVTKKDILEVLTEKFPDREESGMKATINVQVPGRLNSRGFSVQKNEKGYWLDKDSAPTPTKGKDAPKKGKKSKSKKEEVEEDVDSLEATQADDSDDVGEDTDGE